MKRIVIIGGGITGLAAAYRALQLAKTRNTPIQLLLIEASSRLGGTLQTQREQGCVLEAGPDCFIASKPRGVELCQELGLSDQLISTRPEFRRSFIVKGGVLQPIPEGFYLLAPAKLRPFLSSSLLSWKGKWRALLEPLIPARRQGDESLASFVRRRMGKEVLDWLAQPLLAGIYAADPETLSLQSTFPQFLEMEKKYGSVLLGLKKISQGPSPLVGEGKGGGSPHPRPSPTGGEGIETASGARYSLFVTLREGMGSLVTKLVESIPKASIRLNTSATSLQRTATGWDVQLGNGESVSADAVCLCLGPSQAATLLALQDRPLSEQLATISCTTSVTVNLAFEEYAIRHPLDGIGFVTPQREAGPALACTFVHRKFDGRAPEGTALLRAFVGGHAQLDLLEKSDDEIKSVVINQLSTLLSISGPPKLVTIERWPNAMPQYTVGHLGRILKIEEMVLGLPGLALAGNWQYGVGIPDCIESGERAAGLLIR